MSDALEGLKVVEFGEFISAPFCGKLLADLGAEVIKIEAPKVGDESRRFGPFPGDVPHREKSGAFLYLNTNKQSVTLNPKTATGQDIFKSLIADADVLVENQQPGVMEELGLAYRDLAKVNPQLIHTSITSFGHSGPYAKFKGYDLQSWEGSGVAHRWCGEPDQEPIRGAWYHANHWGGVCGATTIMIALTGRDLTGEGQFVDVSEADCMACHILGYELVTLYNLTGEHLERAGEEMRGGAPVGLLTCKDGYFYIMALEVHHWRGVVKAMGSPEWATNPLYDAPSWVRAEYGDAIRMQMQPWLDAHTKDELFDLFQAQHVPAGPLYTTGELLKNKHLNQRGFFATPEHPAAGSLKMPGAPYKLTETPWHIRMPAPTLGQHNQLIYGGRLGFSNVDLTDLRRTGII
ncbi:MAG: CoA transferase [Chloroflexi bacterium]|nr:CoA transferase [Chloroflexota bacterium]